MSDYERNTKRLIKIECVDSFVESSNFKLLKFYNSKMEQFLDDPDGYGAVKINGVLYAVEDLGVDNRDPEYCHIKTQDDGSIIFDSFHYNGGAHWSEVVGDEMKRLAKSNP